MIEMLQMRIMVSQSQQRDRFSSDFDKDSKTEDGYNSEDERAKQLEKLTEEEKLMNGVLEDKKQKVVALLIHWISSNKVDYEKCLNAHFILVELADHEATYGKLVQKDNLTALVLGACDFKNPYQAYALNVLTTIIREFPNFERLIGPLAAEF